jgi:excisionase family DNA binding protein
MYAVIRQYRVDPDRSEELIQLVEEQLVPLVEKVPGFVAYYLVDTDEGTIASMSICKDRIGQEECSRLAEEWVKENLQTLFLFSPKSIDGAFMTVEGTVRGGTRETSNGHEDSWLEGTASAEVPERLESAGSSLRLLSVEEVCAILGMGKSWVYRRMRSGEIPTLRLGRALKVRLSDLEEYLEDRRWQPSDED